MSDFETEGEMSAYWGGMHDGRMETLVVAIDKMLDLTTWAERVSILNYLQSKQQVPG